MATVLLVGHDLKQLHQPLAASFSPLHVGTVAEAINLSPNEIAVLIVRYPLPSEQLQQLLAHYTGTPWVLAVSECSPQVLKQAHLHRCSELILLTAPETEVVWRLQKLLEQHQARDLIAKELDSWKEQSEKDPLTRVYNRRGFEHHGCQLIGQAQRRKEALSLLLLDLDHFKQVNDQLGHAAGDHMLLAFCKRLKECLRSYDLIARLGGDEFAVVVPHCDLEDGINIGNKVIEHLKQRTVNIQEQQFTIEVSIGVSTLQPTTPVTADYQHLLHTILDSADKALYHAKEKGRNCTFGQTLYREKAHDNQEG